MFVFIIANLPLPIIIFLNLRVTWRFWRVHRLTARGASVKRPHRLVQGWWLGNVSMIFAFLPMIWEGRIFVHNHWWLVSYAIAATLSITGLRMMASGLGQELDQLSRRGSKRTRRRVAARSG